LRRVKKNYCLLSTVVKMTRAEKVSISLAVISLVISISTPIATYFWLDPNIRAFKDRAKLQVSGDLTDTRIIQDLGKVVVSRSGSFYDLSVLNVGKLPAKEIQIVAQYGIAPPDDRLFTLDPPLHYEIRNVGRQTFITIKRPLPVQDSFKVTFVEIPFLLTVSSESGESTVINIAALSLEKYLSEQLGKDTSQNTSK